MTAANDEPTTGRTASSKTPPTDIGCDQPHADVHTPIAVWRLDDSVDQDDVAPRRDFTARLSRQLVTTYASNGQIVGDYDNNEHLQQAAAATGRRYLDLSHPLPVIDVDAFADPVGLITLRWPRPPHTPPTSTAADLLAACALMASPDSTLVVIVASASPGQPTTTYAEHVRLLLPAAQECGLRLTRQIVALGGADSGDRFVYYADEAEAARLRTETANDTSTHVDLLVFCTGAGRA